MDDPQLAGDAAEIRRQARLLALDPILRRARGVFNAGRVLGIEAPHELGDDELVALARDFGGVNLFFVELEAAERYRALASRVGLGWEHFPLWESGPSTWSTLLELRSSVPPLPDADMVTVEGAPPAASASFQALSMASGLVPMPGYMLRGHGYETVCRLLVDPGGDPLASVYLASRHGVDGAYGGWFCKAMSAVREDQRGRGFGTALQLHTLVELHRRGGVRGVYAAIAPSNEPSQRLNARLGLAPRGRSVVALTDRPTDVRG